MDLRALLIPLLLAMATGAIDSDASPRPDEILWQFDAGG